MPEFKFKITYNGQSYIYKVNASNKLDAWAKANEHIKSKFKGDLQYEVDCKNINNISYNTMSTEKKKMVNFNFEGWPEYKYSVKDILIEFGATLNEKTGMWEIPDSEDLNIYPRLLEDDGMGYGSNERYIISVDFNNEDGYCNIWNDAELPNIELYAEAEVYPGEFFKIDNNDYFINELIKDEDGKVYANCMKWMYSEDENGQMENPIKDKTLVKIDIETLKKYINEDQTKGESN